MGELLIKISAVLNCTQESRRLWVKLPWWKYVRQHVPPIIVTFWKWLYQNIFRRRFKIVRRLSFRTRWHTVMPMRPYFSSLLGYDKFRSLSVHLLIFYFHLKSLSNDSAPTMFLYLCLTIATSCKACSLARSAVSFSPCSFFKLCSHLVKIT